MIKNPSANAGVTGDASSIPGLGRSPAAWQPTPVFFSGESHGLRSLVVTKSQTQRKRQQAHIGLCHFPTLKPFKGPYHL